MTQRAPAQLTPVAVSDASPEVVSAYPDIRTVLLGGIFFLMTMCVTYVARDLLIPVVLAFVLKLVFQPVQRFVEGLCVPRTLASLIVVAILVAGLSGLMLALSTPAAIWMDKFSDSLPMLQKRVSAISHPMESVQKVIVSAESMTQVETRDVVPVAVQGTRLYDRVFLGTQTFFWGLFTSIIVFFFLLAAGDTFLRRIVEILPRFKDKRQAVNMSQQIENNISAYLLTITLMNVAVGVVTGAIMVFFGREDAVLWGVFAFLLNYVPVVGPLIGFAIFAMAGLLMNQGIGEAILPATLYLGVHIVESSFITPLLLARRFTLNPVIVIFSLVFWYWMWGVAGALLAMPMLAIIKIVCDGIDRLKPVGHFLEG